MNIKDYITIAKAGLKPSDIKELTSLSSDLSAEDIISLTKAGYKTDDIKELISLPVSDTATDPAPEVAPGTGEVVEPEKEVIDYKALYEASQIELNNARKDNIHKDISSGMDNTPSDNDIIKNYFREFVK